VRVCLALLILSLANVSKGDSFLFGPICDLKIGVHGRKGMRHVTPIARQEIRNDDSNGGYWLAAGRLRSSTDSRSRNSTFTAPENSYAIVAA
jgi:hypothetical protein